MAHDDERPVLLDLLHQAVELHLHLAGNVHDEGALPAADERRLREPAAADALEDLANSHTYYKGSAESEGEGGSFSFCCLPALCTSKIPGICKFSKMLTAFQ